MLKPQLARWTSIVRREVPPAVIDLPLVWLSYALAVVVRGAAATSDVDYTPALLFALFASALVVICNELSAVFRTRWGDTSGGSLARDVAHLGASIACASVLTVAADLAWPGARPMPLGAIFLGGFFGLCGMIAVRHATNPLAALEVTWRSALAPPLAALGAAWRSVVAPPRAVILAGRGSAEHRQAPGVAAPGLSVVLPAYNEEPVIGATVRAVVDSLDELADDYEVIVVDDGSRDRTAEVVAALARGNPAIRCVSHTRNRGYGAALATGFAAARGELVFLTDGDKQFDVRQLGELLPLIQQADLVIGYRSPRRDPLIRRVIGWNWNRLINLLFGYTARDVDCAFKLFRRSVLERLPLAATGATFSAELLIKARRLGYRVVERPVRHYPRPAGRATGAHPAVIARAFRELLRLRLHLNEQLPPPTTSPASSATIGLHRGARARARTYLPPLAVLLLLFACWSSLGTWFYQKVEPFYDSAAYQEQYFRILDHYRSAGYASTLALVQTPGITFSYGLFTALFSPVLPRSILGFYWIIYGLALLSLMSLFYAARKLSSSSSKALAVVFFITSSAIFSLTWGGILDQRLDLLAGLLFSASAACFWLLMTAPDVFRYWLLFLLTTMLCILHRPIIASQALPVFAIIAGFHYKQARCVFRVLRAKHYAALLLSAVVLASFLLPAFTHLRLYYLELNVDVGRAGSSWDALLFGLSSMRWLLGNYILGLFVLLCAYALAKRRYSDVLFAVSLVGASMIPFVISRSGANPLVLLPSSMLLVLSSLALIRRIESRTLVAVLLLVNGFVSINNLGELSRRVESVSAQERETLDRITEAMSRSRPPVYVSGTAPVAGSMVAIDRFYGSDSLRYGKIMSHSTDFGLGKVYDLSGADSLNRVTNALREICNLRGYAVLPTPDLPDDERSYLFSFRHRRLIWEHASRLGCLGEQVDQFRYGGADYAVYTVAGR